MKVNVPGKVACSCRETPCWGRCCWSCWSWRTRSAGRWGWSRPAFAAAERVTWSQRVQCRSYTAIRFQDEGHGWDLGAACSLQKMERLKDQMCNGSCIHLCPPHSVNQQNRLEKGNSSIQVELGCALATPQKNIWNTALCWLEGRTAVWSPKILLFKICNEASFEHNTYSGFMKRRHSSRYFSVCTFPFQHFTTSNRKKSMFFFPLHNLDLSLGTTKIGTRFPTFHWPQEHAWSFFQRGLLCCILFSHWALFNPSQIPGGEAVTGTQLRFIEVQI